MSKPYSEDDFSAQVTEDRSWRLKEISDLKDAIGRADEGLQRVLLRALITICYAHWEGYIRFAARKYLEHVSLRKFQYDELDRQFLRNYFLPRLASLATSKTSIAERCILVDDILNSSDRRFSRVNEDLVNTKANLNSDVFADICLVCGIPIESFADKATFIDIFLLKGRNEIAHGEETFVALQDLDRITNETVALMRGFGDLLENRVYLKEYRATAA
jgi:RiboL-PSP-HEPN